MMKKLLFLMASGFIATGAFAQSGNETVVKLRNVSDVQGFPAQPPAKSHEAMRLESLKNSSQKTTAGNNRWYEPWAAVDAYLGGGVLTAQGHTFVNYMAYDSTYLQTYSDGPGPVTFLGVGQVFDPIHAVGFNKVDRIFPNNNREDIGITMGDDYKVDSVYLRGAYVLGEDPTKGQAYFEGLVDTMIFSLTTISYSSITNYTVAQYPDVANYLSVTDSGNVAKQLTMPAANFNTRGFTTASAKTWKVPMFARDEANPADANGFLVSTRTFEVPGGFNVPKGMAFALSAVYKPGEPKEVGRDSVNYYNYFMYSTARTDNGDGWAMYPYYAFNDKNMAHFMHRRLMGGFNSALILEALNGNRFSGEFILTGAFLNCTSCKSLKELSIKDVNNGNISVNVFPNPATTEVSVPFTLTNAADVTVTLTNAVGQVVKAESFKAATSNTAVFSTSDLANGVYIYTVEANGQRQTGRVAVQH